MGVTWSNVAVVVVLACKPFLELVPADGQATLAEEPEHPQIQWNMEIWLPRSPVK